MTLYEKIKTIVESWHIAITQDTNSYYVLRSSMMFDWFFRCSWNYYNAEKCYENLGIEHKGTEEIKQYEKAGAHYIWIYQRPLRIPKVGDIVQVLENVKQLPQYETWSYEKK